MPITFNLTPYAQNAMLDRILRNDTSVTLPSAIYVGALTALSADGGTITELVGSGYARGLMGFDPASSRKIVSNSEVNLGSSSADWSATTHLGLFDASSSGHAWGWARVDGRYAITAVSTGSKAFTVAGDQSANITTGIAIRVKSSTGNDGRYTVTAVSVTGGNTVVTVSETVASSTADGLLVGPSPITIVTGQSLTLPAGSLIVAAYNNDLSDTMVHRVLDSVFRAQSWTAIPAVYHALFNSLTGDTYTEPADNYARQAATFAAASGSVSANSAAVGYPTVDTGWSSIVAEGLLTASAVGTGTLIARKARAVAVTGSAGKRFRYAAGVMTFSLD